MPDVVLLLHEQHGAGHRVDFSPGDNYVERCYQL